jgi:hypothetical protein
MLTQEFYLFFKKYHQEFADLKITVPNDIYIAKGHAERLYRDLTTLFKDYCEIKQEDSTLEAQLVKIGGLDDGGLQKKAKEIKSYWRLNKKWLTRESKSSKSKAKSNKKKSKPAAKKS